MKQKVEPNWIFLELHVKSFPGSQQVCEVASGDHNYEHQEDEYNHDVQAELTADLDFVRSAAPVGAPATNALGSRLTLIKIFLHAKLTDIYIARAVSK